MSSFDLQGTIHGPTLSRSDDAPRKRPKIMDTNGRISASDTLSRGRFGSSSSSTVPALSMRKGIRVKLPDNAHTDTMGNDAVPMYRNIDAFFGTTKDLSSSSSSSSSPSILGSSTSSVTAATINDNFIAKTSGSTSSSSAISLTSVSHSLHSFSTSPSLPSDANELNYYAQRNKKLREQMDPSISSLFRGLVFYINGNTGINMEGGLTHHHLVRLISRYGGSCYLEPKVGKLTHIVATSLTLSKIEKYLHRAGSKIIPIIHPQYIIDCIKQQSLLPDISYRIIHDTTGTNLHQYFTEPVCRNPLVVPKKEFLRKEENTATTMDGKCNVKRSSNSRSLLNKEDTELFSNTDVGKSPAKEIPPALDGRTVVVSEPSDDEGSKITSSSIPKKNHIIIDLNLSSSTDDGNEEEEIIFIQEKETTTAIAKAGVGI